MAIVTDYLGNFSGGEIDARSSLEFDETQWSSLYGFVYDNNRRIRTQWAQNEWSVALPEPEGS